MNIICFKAFCNSFVGRVISSNRLILPHFLIMLAVAAAEVSLYVLKIIIRPFYYPSGLVGLFLGSMPNFLAGFFVPLLGLSVYYHIFYGKYEGWQGRYDIIHHSIRIQLTAAVLVGISTVGLLGWEYVQQFGGLYFDPYDILATFIGAGSALYFVVCLPEYVRRIENHFL